jgi:hypothetical protein
MTVKMAVSTYRRKVARIEKYDVTRMLSIVIWKRKQPHCPFLAFTRHKNYRSTSDLDRLQAFWWLQKIDQIDPDLMISFVYTHGFNSMQMRFF